MPSVSPKQAKLMRAVAHGWKKPGGHGPSPKVAKEFVRADRQSHPGARNKEQIADRKSAMDKWAKGK
jgi:hypothetical protein